MDKLQNQVAVVTGGGSGVGAAIAIECALRGAKVCLVGRKLEKLDEVANQIRQNSGDALVHQTDLSDDSQIDELAAYLLKTCERIDVLIHSAGAIKLGEFANSSRQEFDDQYHINVRAPFALTQALLPALRRSNGQIVFINSTAGLNARAKSGQYAATKHALRAIADSLRDEVNQDGIRVLTVYLGRTATALQHVVNQFEGNEYRPERYIQPEDVASVVLNALTMPRTAEITDVHLRPMLKTY